MKLTNEYDLERFIIDKSSILKNDVADMYGDVETKNTL